MSGTAIHKLPELVFSKKPTNREPVNIPQPFRGLRDLLDTRSSVSNQKMHGDRAITPQILKNTPVFAVSTL
jgi:hypothetical protein